MRRYLIVLFAAFVCAACTPVDATPESSTMSSTSTSVTAAPSPTEAHLMLPLTKLVAQTADPYQPLTRLGEAVHIDGSRYPAGTVFSFSDPRVQVFAGSGPLCVGVVNGAGTAIAEQCTNTYEYALSFQVPSADDYYQLQLRWAGCDTTGGCWAQFSNFDQTQRWIDLVARW